MNYSLQNIDTLINNYNTFLIGLALSILNTQDIHIYYIRSYIAKCSRDQLLFLYQKERKKGKLLRKFKTIEGFFNLL